MEPLPGNRQIQESYVEQHMKEWGDSIDRMGHLMSGLVIGEAIPQADPDGFLPEGIKVQVCHGLHRKLVMEERVKGTLMMEHILRKGRKEPANLNFLGSRS